MPRLARARAGSGDQEKEEGEAALAAVWWLRGGWRLPLAASAGCATRTGHCFGPKLTENLGLLVARFWFSGQTESDWVGRKVREAERRGSSGRIALQCIALHRPFLLHCWGGVA